METKDLWAKPADCCGCGACAALCPRGSISMEESPEGFVYPRIDTKLCVDCGLCRRACGLQNRYAQETSGPWYAACYRGDSSLSASAGAFYGLARAVIDGGGVAFGAAYVREEDGLHVRHIMAEEPGALVALQGSKYVQSDAGCCFPEVKRQLVSGKEVLFSGTPCQVAGLRGYLGRDWSNLITVDLVCHGVPSEAMLQDYLGALGRSQGAPVVSARFRSKRDGWNGSLLLEIEYTDGSREYIPYSDSSYYDLFFNLKIFRNSCYSCPFASQLRPGDLTVGDFWGVQQNRPDVLEDGRFDMEQGVSCLIVNTERGRGSLARYGFELDRLEVSFDDIAKGNDQLRHPSLLPCDRDAYLSAYREGGWDEVEAHWRRCERGAKYRMKRVIKDIVPRGLIDIAKGVAGRYRC